ncbi:MAG: FAD-dependent oxidoreductase, partial [Verrucomicrobia bacterium]|nr:FAD-dependent oxidoreductase [Verrucomicrobiota bacterium]
MENVIIVGTGCAGLTAAIYTARADLNPLVIEGNQPGGQLTTTSEVENFPGWPEGIDGYSLMDNLRKQAIRFGTRFENNLIDSVDLSGEIKILKAGDKTYEAKTVIISTGASPRLLGLDSEKQLFGTGGVSTCATCDGAFYRGMDVTVIGGGDSACEEALFLTRFASKVTLIHRRDKLRASKIMADRTLANEKIEMCWDSLVTNIEGAEGNAVTGVSVKNIKTGEEKTIPCKGAFIAIGHIPNTQAFANALKTDENGYFLAEDSSQVKTNVEGVYVAG